MPKITILEGNSKDKDKIRVFMVKGEKGDTGDTGNGIESIEKTATVGNIDTYTITFTNGATYDFDVANGESATVVVDNLTDTSTNKALSSNQGRVLKGLVDDLDTDKVNISDIVDDLTSTATNKPLSANQGKELKGLIDSIPTPIKVLSESIYLIDGETPTLETGFYISGSYGIYVNGDLDQNFVRSLFYYDDHYPMFSLIYSFDGSHYIDYNLDTDNLGAWKNDIQYSVDYTNTIQNSPSLIPTSQAVYNALQRNILTGYDSSGYILQSTGTEEIVPLNQMAKVGDKLSINNDGGIVIGSNVSYIKVSGNLTFSSFNGSTGVVLRSADIYKNNSCITHNEGIAKIDDNTFTYGMTFTFSDILIPVSQYDVIYLKVFGKSGDTLSTFVNTNSYLTVEAVG